MIDADLVPSFIELFSNKPSVHVSAPGRVNIIGEHTDYNEGFVLPCALHYRTEIVARRREDSLVNAYSLQYPGQHEQFDLNHEINHGEFAWGDYLRGVVKELLTKGCALQGMDLIISSDVPQGCGLSSSAALEVAIAGTFNHQNSLSLSNAEIARIGQLAENNFIDCKCGIMDQLISANAKAHSALLIDCMDLSSTTVHIPEQLALLVINSNYPRKLADSEYNQRRVACETAAKTMNVNSLRHASMKDLEKVKASISDSVYRRAKHVITENQRVIDMAKALNEDNINGVYKLMQSAHMSLKNDFEITVSATDGLVDIVMSALNNNGACRQTGGGFGGAVVCLCDRDDVDKVINAVEQNYFSQFDLHADILLCEPAQGLTVQALF